MKTIVVLIAAIACTIGCQPQKASDTSAKPETEKKSAEITKESFKSIDDKVNYAVGIEIGKNIKRNGLALNDDIFMKGIHDGVNEKEPLLPEEEMRDVKRDHAKAQREIREKERAEEAKKNKAEGEKFLEENKKKEGIKVTESGLQYKVLKEGDGEKPGPTDKVKVHYKGTLIDGTEFDSSFKRDTPATFGVNRVVKGWTEALQLMPVGSKWQVFIPSELGYGERGSRGKIGPNSVLIFEMELIEIVKDEKKPDDPNKKTITVNPDAAKAKADAVKKDAKPAEKKEEKTSEK